jgi:hypothetical protein
MAQTLLPISQLSNTSWQGDGGQTTNLHHRIDESGTPNDADFITSIGFPASTIRFGLTSSTDPVSSSGHILRTRYEFGAAGTVSCTMVVNLKDGSGSGTIRATRNITVDVGVSGWVDDVWTLSSGEADAIADYTTLKLEYIVTAVVDEQVDISRAYFEIPDAPAGQPAVRRTARKDIGRAGVITR